MARILYISLIVFLIILSNLVTAQREDKITFNEGVDSYKDGKYSDAQRSFEAAYEKNKNNTRALYNAGNAAYLNGDFDQAYQYFSDYSKVASSSNEKAKAYYNQGNTLLQQADALNADPKKKKDAQELYKQAVTSYKNALKNNPDDQDAKYNLTYALDKIQKNQNGDKNQDQEKEKNEDQNDGQGGDGDNDQNENSEKDQDQNNENQDQENENQDQKNGDQGENDKNQDQKSDSEDDKQGDKGDEKEEQGDTGDQEKNEGENGEEENQDSNGQGQGKEEQNEQQAQVSRAQAVQDLDAINEEEEGILKKVYGSRNGDKKGSVSSGKDW